MKLRTVEITVGVFIILGIMSLLMLALQVSGLNHFFKTENGYQVKAEFSNIGGLKARAKVSVAGVVVGRVTKIQLEPSSFNATVWMVIDPKRVDHLPSDTRASILTAGLLGDNYISLTPGFSENPLKEGGFISVMDTDSAIVLEQLVSRFLANQVTAKQANLNDTQPSSQTSTSPQFPSQPQSEPEPQLQAPIKYESKPQSQTQLPQPLQ